jgi:sugar-specific transcriptional regulator TrmB
MSELINKLKSLGFTEYESRIFLALLQGHFMSATEIAESAKVRRTDVYNVLKSFVEKGYCNEIETNTIMKYEMIDPDVILDKIEDRIQKEKEKQVSSFKDAFKTLKPLYRSKEQEKDKISNIELIRGYNLHREGKFFNLLKNAKKEILFMIRLEIYISDEVDKTAEKFIKSGGAIKSIYEVGNNFKVKKDGKWAEGNVDDLVKIFSKFEKYGEQVRLSNVKIPNFTVFDRETVFMNIVDKTVPRYNEADIIIKNKDYAESMVEVFNTFWEKSYTLKEYKKIK